MKNVIILLFTILFSHSILANDSKIDLNAFASLYFDKMVSTQRPHATSKELEAYLALLTDDVGHSHLPWVTDDSRLPSGKQDMRKGMTFYLGAHTKYQAELLDVFTFNNSAIAIRYKKYAKGIHPQNNQPIEYSQTIMEVLEIENGKVAVIRKYHE
ncbi:nuclear transport factor 2 family protein [Thalassotalea sp. PLHSN55]|uniref:nuclear transport factor 2 family protein n=1 Tax=Thalassotalea sp. PLHSN55 TaxID=3435888 RepID=UPI003F85C0F3